MKDLIKVIYKRNLSKNLPIELVDKMDEDLERDEYTIEMFMNDYAPILDMVYQDDRRWKLRIVARVLTFYVILTIIGIIITLIIYKDLVETIVTYSI